jgi:hypothetical protein
LRRIAQALRPGGACYIEDFSERAPFPEPDLRDLRDIVFGITVTGIDAYVADLRAAGFNRIEAIDLTDQWVPFVTERLTTWRANQAVYTRGHSAAAYHEQERFYAAVARLFESGRLGGLRVVAHVP